MVLDCVLWQEDTDIDVDDDGNDDGDAAIGAGWMDRGRGKYSYPDKFYHIEFHGCNEIVLHSKYPDCSYNHNNNKRILMIIIGIITVERL